MYEYLEAAAKHPSPAYYQLVAELLVRERKSDEAIAAPAQGRGARSQRSLELSRD